MTPAEYLNEAMEFEILNLRATFGPLTDPDVVKSVNNLATLVVSMRQILALEASAS